MFVVITLTNSKFITKCYGFFHYEEEAKKWADYRFNPNEFVVVQVHPEVQEEGRLNNEQHKIRNLHQHIDDLEKQNNDLSENYQELKERVGRLERLVKTLSDGQTMHNQRINSLEQIPDFIKEFWDGES